MEKSHYECLDIITHRTIKFKKKGHNQNSFQNAHGGIKEMRAR